MPLDPDSPGGHLVTELHKEDSRLKDAREAYLKAKQSWDVAVARYCAVRDTVTKELGRSPYAADAQWEWTNKDAKTGRETKDRVTYDTKGRYRFLGMSLGDAVEQVLSEATEPLALWDISRAISQGTLDDVPGRELNGALTGKVGKTVVKVLMPNDQPPRYRAKNEWIDSDELAEEPYRPESDDEREVEPDDIPF